MKLIIDIPDDVYDECKGDVYFPDTGGIVWEGVRNGIPLPKGHGDLIDRSELLKEPMDKANCPSNYVRIAKAIIEADTPKKRKGTALEENDSGYNCENWIP